MYKQDDTTSLRPHVLKIYVVGIPVVGDWYSMWVVRLRSVLRSALPFRMEESSGVQPDEPSSSRSRVAILALVGDAAMSTVI